MKLSKYKPMTQKQLKDIVADYASAFPEWTLITDGVGFSRSVGPVTQLIWFQKMNYAAYRPTHVVNTTALSMPRMLHQVLDVKSRETEYRLHESKWRSVLAAMEQQFKPAIRNPLEVAEVLKLCKAEARLSAANDLAMLAILYAWEGLDAEAHDACDRMQKSTPSTLAPIPEWEEKMQVFSKALSAAIDAGTGRQFIEKSIEESRAK